MNAGHRSTQPHQRISLIIPAYNEEKYIAATLENVGIAVKEYQHRTGLPVEVIVVNNNSTDRTAEIAGAHGATVVFEAHNNIASARNAGARAAQGEIVAFLDADDHLSSNLLWLVDEVMSSGRYVGGGVKIRWDSTTPALLLYNAFVGALRWLSGLSTGLIYTTKETFDRLGGFDERYYATEETRFVVALHKLGAGEGRRFSVIRRGHVVKSARKFTGSGLRPLLEVRFLLKPKKLTDREACSYWYDRKKG